MDFGAKQEHIAAVRAASGRAAWSARGSPAEYGR